MSGFHRIFRLSAVFLPSLPSPARPPSNTVSRARVYASPSLPSPLRRPLAPSRSRSARDHGPLSRPVIKQPRGRQIESVEETRERGRRGDGQPAATMVSIVKGAIRRVRTSATGRTEGGREKREEGERVDRWGEKEEVGEDRCELALAPSIRTFTSWTPN